MPQSSRKNRVCVPLRWAFVSNAADGFIDLIVGKGLADQRDMTRYERELSSAEMRNKAVRKVVYEFLPAVDHPSKSELEPLLARTRSLAGAVPEQGSIRPSRVRRRGLKSHDGYITPSGPPDISCKDIPEEQLSRTYSRSSVWDPRIDPVPPMQEMEGFGRFRRSVHADANWELSKFRGDLQTLGPVAVHHLGDFEIARLKVGVMNNIRTPSFASLASHSDSGESSTAPRICRGFTPSKVSETANANGERRSSMSHTRSRGTSPDLNEGTNGPMRPYPKRTSFLRFEGGPAALATIEEATDNLQKKKAVPLIFNAQGTADEVIDDDDYESCEESLASAQVPVRVDKHGATTTASNLHEKKGQIPHIVLPTRTRGTRHHRTFDNLPEKVRLGQKKSTKPMTRRLSSRGSKAIVNRAVLKENVPGVAETNPPVSSKALTSANKSIPPPTIFSPKPVPTSSEESADGSAVVIDVYMVEPNVTATVLVEDSEMSHHPRSTNQLVTPAFPPKQDFSKAQGRKSSATAFRVCSGNIPIICMDASATKLPDIAEMDRKNLQVVTA